MPKAFKKKLFANSTIFINLVFETKYLIKLLSTKIKIIYLNIMDMWKQQTWMANRTKMHSTLL